MKNIKIILLIISFCITPTINAGFFSKIAKAFGVKDNSPIMSIANSIDGVGNAYVAKKVDETIKEYGGEYKDDPNVREGLYNLIGISNDDLDKAKKWEEADKYGKRNIIIDEVTNIVEQHSSNPNLVRSISNMAQINNNYLKEKAKGNPDAVTNRTIDLMNICYDAAQIHNERKKEINKRIGEITNHLISTGQYEKNRATIEIAGNILAIQNDKSLTEDEKIEWLTDLGFHEQETKILDIAEQVNSIDIKELEEPVKTGPTPEEIEEAKRKEQEEKERIEKEKKSNAISQINQTVVNEYAINNIELNDKQKASLDSVADIMTQYDDLNIKITGHTCNLGYKAVNEKIGQKRSDIAKAYLIEKGISEERIIADTMGEECPKVENNNKDNRKLNRRIEFVVE